MLSALLLTIVVAVLYLALIRVFDMNESEPLWAVGMLFVLGGIAAVGLRLVTSAELLELTLIPSAALKEGARTAAIGAGLGTLAFIGRRRGFSDINGIADGIVYGASGGLGYAAGDVLGRSFAIQVEVPGDPAFLSNLVRIALSGLVDGVLGALIGAAIVGALESRKGALRVGLPLAGYAGAVLGHAAHAELSHGNALGGTEGFVRAWVGLLLPAVVVVGLGVFALSKERRAIRDQLAGEAGAHVVTSEDLALLLSFSKRQALYAKALVRGNVDFFIGLRDLHNRQVQLALAKQRAASGANIDSEVAMLRSTVLDQKRTLEGRS